MDSDRDPLIGRTIGNYVIRGRLGEGGMGVLYVAEHPRIGRKVAIKTLRPQYSENPAVVRRFFHEAKAAHEIRNPHIVDIIDFGELEDGTSYITMELLEGRSLQQAVTGERVMGPGRALHIIDGVLEALVGAHAAGIVHRDLKPDNVFLVKHGADRDFVKVLDFGIAKLTADNMSSDAHRTGTGMLLGTPAYMSPEQCKGRSDLDARSDLYSVGCILYRLVCGQLPFNASAPGEFIVHHVTTPPTPPRELVPSLSPAIDAMIVKALEKDRERRFASAEEFRAAVEQARVGTSAPRHEGTASLETVMSPSSGAVTPWSQRPQSASAASEVTVASDAAIGAASTPSTSAPRSAPIEKAVSTGSGPTTLGGASGESLVQPRPPRRWRAAVGAVAIAVAAVAILLGARNGRHAQKPPTAAATVEKPTPPAPAVPAAPPSAHFAIAVEPAAARILLDGSELPNPFDGRFERSDVRHRLEATAPGFTSFQDWVVFDQDRALKMALTREPAPPVAAAPPATRARPAAAGRSARPSSATAPQGNKKSGWTEGSLITDFPAR
jgi:serine/threonine-protein kinase